jgi:hypothetical protein
MVYLLKYLFLFTAPLGGHCIFGIYIGSKLSFTLFEHHVSCKIFCIARFIDVDGDALRQWDVSRGF